jgi:NitT/TauT family transport system substrate-binding protein
LACHGSRTRSRTAATATGAGSATSGGGAASGDLKKVKLQLQWVKQAQFAGYIAAVDQGFYEEAGLDVELLDGAPDIVPQSVLANGGADFAIAWVPKALATREQGAQITDIGQIFQRSGTLQVSWKDSSITSPAAFKSKKIGNWGFGNEFELFAGMTKSGLDPSKDVTLVQQEFNMSGLLSRQIDAAQAMTYNEYAQLLEAKDPATGKLHTADDFNVISWNDVGTSMLQDSIWADTSKLKSDPDYQDTAVKLLKGSIKGWVFCRDNPQQCADIVVQAGSELGASHQLWQMNEVNKLIWPSPSGIGVVNQADWDRTVEIALNTKNAEGQTVLTKTPDGDGYNNNYVQTALTELKAENLDVNGAGFEPITVELKENGA